MKLVHSRLSREVSCRLRRGFSTDLRKRRDVLRSGPGLSEFLDIPIKKEMLSLHKPEEEMMENGLMDRFGRVHNYLRISLTERCNFRCTYCMPAEGVDLSPESSLLTSNEILRLATVFAQMGTRKVRLTGGEPTLRKDLVDLCREINALNNIDSVGLTTNGVLLTKMLDQLVDAGVSTINVSLDSIDPQTFSKMTKRPPQTLDKVLDALAAGSKLSNSLKLKLNCVVMRGQNEHQISGLVDFFLKNTARFPHLDIRFIEWMPFNANEWRAKTLVPSEEMQAILSQAHTLDALPAMDPNDTTRWFSVRNAPADAGRIGIISSMTQHFCGGCNRVRLTSDGALKTCLFGTDAVSLRDLLRDGATDLDLASAIQGALQLKHFKHGGQEEGAIGLARDSDKNRPMVHIGG